MTWRKGSRVKSRWSKFTSETITSQPQIAINLSFQKRSILIQSRVSPVQGKRGNKQSDWGKVCQPLLPKPAPCSLLEAESSISSKPAVVIWIQLCYNVKQERQCKQPKQARDQYLHHSMEQVISSMLTTWTVSQTTDSATSWTPTSVPWDLKKGRSNKDSKLEKISSIDSKAMFLTFTHHSIKGNQWTTLSAQTAFLKVICKTCWEPHSNRHRWRHKLSQAWRRKEFAPIEKMKTCGGCSKTTDQCKYKEKKEMLWKNKFKDKRKLIMMWNNSWCKLRSKGKRSRIRTNSRENRFCRISKTMSYLWSNRRKMMLLRKST